ncbi:MAG: hypothetical protein WCL28_00815 [bacterium]
MKFLALRIAAAELVLRNVDSGQEADVYKKYYKNREKPDGHLQSELFKFNNRPQDLIRTLDTVGFVSVSTLSGFILRQIAGGQVTTKMMKGFAANHPLAKLLAECEELAKAAFFTDESSELKLGAELITYPMREGQPDKSPLLEWHLFTSQNQAKLDFIFALAEFAKHKKCGPRKLPEDFRLETTNDLRQLYSWLTEVNKDKKIESFYEDFRKTNQACASKSWGSILSGGKYWSRRYSDKTFTRKLTIGRTIFIPLDSEAKEKLASKVMSSSVLPQIGRCVVKLQIMERRSFQQKTAIPSSKNILEKLCAKRS